MNTTKKLLVVAMVALLAAVSVMPSTFSWYDHNGTASGGKLNYNDSLDVSMKSASNTVSMSTVKTDAKGTIGDAVSSGGISVNAATSSVPKRVQYYKTTLTNTGANDVMVNLETTNFPNNADFYIGTTSPTLNEKAYASKPLRKKATGTTTRVYFKTRSSYSDFWNANNNMEANKTLDTENAVGSSNGTTCDINIAYKADGVAANFDGETLARMAVCPTASASDSTGTTKVFYFDLPNNTEYFYFFNHWYMTSSSNREWNRTIDINTLSMGTLYYLTGNQVDSKWKEYATRPINTGLVGVNEYYTDVQMSQGNGVFADIGLKKESENDDPDFVPQYYGDSIVYRSSNTNVVTVSKDGLLTPKGSGTANITTTITGVYGDDRVLTTKVNIPDHIDQVPIIQNVRVCAANSTDANGNPTDTVDIYWYAMNTSTSNNLTTASLFLTI